MSFRLGSHDGMRESHDRNRNYDYENYKIKDMKTNVNQNQT